MKGIKYAIFKIIKNIDMKINLRIHGFWMFPDWLKKLEKIMFPVYFNQINDKIKGNAIFNSLCSLTDKTDKILQEIERSK